MEAEAAAQADLSLGLDFKLDEAPAATEESQPTQAPAPSAAADQALEFDLGVIETSAEPAPTAEATGGAAEVAGLALDMDTLLAAPETAPPQPAEAPALPEFAVTEEEAPVASEEIPAAAEEPALSLDALATDIATPAETETSTQPAPEEESIVIESATAPEGGLDFDFEMETPEAPASTSEPAAQPKPAPDLDLSGLSLELGEPAASATGTREPAETDSQEVATKLDLARAYKEMGDREGAREILEEVLKEGTPQQQDDARALLDSLG